jgi:putative transport protein
MNFDWIKTVIMGSGNPEHPSIAHTIFILALVIASGIALSRIKIKGVSFGMTWILFTGIVAGHFLDAGSIHHDTLHFIKEFGLILFVFFIGLQVGPGFFSSLKSGGLKLISLAALVILLGAITTYVIHLITGTPLPTMVGVMSGAVTNTPGLGAAQQAFQDSANPAMVESLGDSISLGYAVAYPLGVIGIILTMIFMRVAMRVDYKRRTRAWQL